MEPLKILIVDDSLTIRAMLEEILARDVHFEICGMASSGDEALAMVNRSLPDVILLDLGLPGINGIEFLDAIHDHWHKMHVIVVSSAAVKNSTQCQEAFDHGAEACFNKARIVQASSELTVLIEEVVKERFRRGSHKGDAVTLPSRAPAPVESATPQ